MLQVPLACDLGQVVPQLASLRNFSGCVELPLRKAAALDPGNMASSPGPGGRAAREVTAHGHRHAKATAQVLSVQRRRKEQQS